MAQSRRSPNLGLTLLIGNSHRLLPPQPTPLALGSSRLLEHRRVRLTELHEGMVGENCGQVRQSAVRQSLQPVTKAPLKMRLTPIWKSPRRVPGVPVFGSFGAGQHWIGLERAGIEARNKLLPIVCCSFCGRWRSHGGEGGI